MKPRHFETIPTPCDRFRRRLLQVEMTLPASFRSASFFVSGDIFARNSLFAWFAFRSVPHVIDFRVHIAQTGSQAS
jgi:hypothetical protein